jgi:hypothetical protein
MCGRRVDVSEESAASVDSTFILPGNMGCKGDEATGEWRKIHNESFMISTPHPVLCG